MNKKNEIILKNLEINSHLRTSINIDSSIDKKFNINSIINTSIGKDIDKYLSKHKSNNKRYKRSIRLKLNDKLIELIKNLDSKNIQILDYFRFLVENELIKEENKKEIKEVKEKKLIIKEGLIEFDIINGSKEDCIIYFNEFISKNKKELNKIHSKEDLRKELRSIVDILIKEDKKYDNYITKTDILKLKSNYLNASRFLTNVFYILNKIFNSNKIDDELRHRIFIFLMKLNVLKNRYVKEELKKLDLCKDDEEINYIQYVNGSFIQYRKWNNYIGEIENPSILLVIEVLSLTRHKRSSKFMKSQSKGFKYNLDGNVISLKQYNKLIENDKLRCKKIYIDNTEFNIFCDTETESRFFETRRGKEYKLTRDEYIKKENENIKYGQEIDLLKIRKFDIINTKMPNKIHEKTLVKTIQACFKSPSKTEYIIWVDECKKKDFGKDTLQYKYERELKKESKIINKVECKIIYSKDIIKDFYESIEGFTRRENYSNTKNVKTNIWFHNLKFDMLNIGLLDRIQENKWELKSFSNNTPRFYKFNKVSKFMNNKGKIIHNEITFLDSFNFFKYSLAVLGEQIGIKKEKEKVDFDKNDNLEVNKSFLEYSLMDTVILNKFMTDFVERGKFLGTIKYGSAGTAFDSFWKTFYDYDKNKIHLHKNRAIEEIELKSYSGGRTQCFNRVDFYEEVCSIDINSSYPSSMLHKLPIEYSHTIVKPSMQVVKEIIDSNDRYGIYHIRVVEDNNNIVPIKRKSKGSLKLLFDNLKDYECYIHEAELKLLIQKNSKFEVIEVIEYKATTELFKSFVEHFMREKTNSKITGDKLGTTIAKLYANSCYGKFAEMMKTMICNEMNDLQLEYFSKKLNISIDQMSSYSGYLDTSIIESENPLTMKDLDMLDIDVSLWEKSPRIQFFGGYYTITDKLDIPNEKSFLPIAGAITSYSRTELYRAMDLIGFDRVVYCDTDSVYYIPDKKRDEILFKNCEDENDFDDKKINLHDSLVSKHYFWGKEYNGKSYSMLTFGNKDNIKIKYININDVDKKTGEKLYTINGEIGKMQDKLQVGSYYYTGFNIKTKGVNLKTSMELQNNLYLTKKWLGVSEQINQYGTTSTQIIKPQFKYLGASRSNYSKSRVKSKEEKEVKYIYMSNELDENGIETGKKQLRYVVTRKYIEQKLENETITNRNGLDLIEVLD